MHPRFLAYFFGKLFFLGFFAKKALHTIGHIIFVDIFFVARCRTDYSVKNNAAHQHNSSDNDDGYITYSKLTFNK